MSKKEQINSVELDLIEKQIIIKNYENYTNDKALLITVLDISGRDKFSEEEAKELIKKELERVID